MSDLCWTNHTHLDVSTSFLVGLGTNTSRSLSLPDLSSAIWSTNCDASFLSVPSARLMHRIADMLEHESLPHKPLRGSASTGLINHGEPGDDAVRMQAFPGSGGAL